MKVSVKEGFSGTLCVSCSSGMITMGKTGKQSVFCHSIEAWVPPIERCSRYTKKGEMALYRIEEIGWIIDNGGPKKVGFAGGIKFVRPGDSRHKQIVDNSTIDDE